MILQHDHEAGEIIAHQVLRAKRASNAHDRGAAKYGLDIDTGLLKCEQYSRHDDKQAGRALKTQRQRVGPVRAARLRVAHVWKQ